MNRIIIIMAKVPRAGNVKTRLQPFLPPAKCRTLAEAFVADAINKARNVCDKLIVAFAPAEKSFFDSENLTLIEQTGANLGEKMAHAFDFAFAENPSAGIVLIGTDSPTFPSEFITQAFEKLEKETEIILGASADGGFYLIGLRRPIAHLFENIEWSSPHVNQQISRNIENLQIDWQTIPAWYDVDTPDDLQRLREEFSRDEQTRKIAPETFRWIAANAEIFD